MSRSHRVMQETSLPCCYTLRGPGPAYYYLVDLIFIYDIRKIKDQIMEQRTFERVPEKIPIDFLYNSKIYEGTVTDLSCTGLQINSETCPSPESSIEVVLILGDAVFNLPAQVKRSSHTNDVCCSIGVELTVHAQGYCEFVSTVLDYYKSPLEKRGSQ